MSSDDIDVQNSVQSRMLCMQKSKNSVQSRMLLRTRQGNNIFQGAVQSRVLVSFFEVGS